MCDCSLLLQSHRHEIHKSHNKAAAQWELREKALTRRLRHPGSPAPLDQASLSIIREVCGTAIFSVAFKVSFAYSMFIVLLEIIFGVFYCCRCSLTSCCCRMCSPALTEPWLWSKTCLEMLHVGRLVESLSFHHSYRYINAALNG